MSETNILRIESTPKRLIYSLSVCLFFIFILFALLMPNDTFNIKKIAFSILFIINIFSIIGEMSTSKYYAVSFHMVIFPILLLLFSLLAGGSLYSTVSNIYVCFYAGLILIAVKRKNNFENLLLFALKIIAIIIIFSAILDFAGYLDIYNNKLLMNLSLSQDAMIGKSASYWSYYVIFLKASPLLLILLGYALKNKKFVLVVFTFTAMFLSGTRANYFAAIIIILFYIFSTNNKYLKIASIIVGLFILVIFFSKFIEYFKTMFISKQVSDNNRIQDYKSIISLFQNHPLTLFIGTGFGDTAAIANYGFTTGTSELSYLDLLRKMGILGLIPFMYFILKPIKTLIQNSETKLLVVTYIIYLMVAATNPLLFSSTAYIYYVYIYIKYYQFKINNTL